MKAIEVPISVLEALDRTWSNLQSPPEGHSLDRIRDDAESAVEAVLAPYRQAVADREHVMFFNSAALGDRTHAHV